MWVCAFGFVNLLDDLLLLVCQLGWEIHNHFYVQVAKVTSASDWHAFFFDDLPAEGLRDTTRAHCHRVAVQVRNSLRETHQRFFQRQIHIIVQVVANSLEHVVRWLLYLEHNVALEHVWHLLTLTFEHNRVSILHASLNVYWERLSFVH